MPNEKIIATLQKLPDAPGIYLFYSVDKELVYVGKATSLRSRVKSYFRGLRSPRPIEELIDQVKDIKWKQTDSVLEAVILEAVYIKKFLPKYNVLGKDNKSWNYIVITKDEFPKVLTIRQHEYQHISNGQSEQSRLYRNVFGPYPGLNTKAAMKLLRQLFDFTNCEPGTRPCLYHQMGQCPGVCAGIISAPEYKRKVIRPLVTFLQGKKKAVIKMLEREMAHAAKQERYEEAGRLRDQLASLYRIQDVALLNKQFLHDAFATPTRSYASYAEMPDNKIMGGRALRQKLSQRWDDDEGLPLRIEGYDISNLGATEKVASMVVFNTDGPVKDQYRKFRIRGVPGQSDVDSLAEVLTRRLRHAEWPLPTVFLIDGGRPQVNRALQILQINRVVVPVVGIAKGPERKRNDFILGNKNPDFITWVNAHRDILIQTRDEAHRFAITFHRLRRSKRFLPRSSKK